MENIVVMIFHELIHSINRVCIKYCVFFKNFKIFQTLAHRYTNNTSISMLLPFSVFPRCQCVYTHQAVRTPALQQNWQSSEKSQNFKEKTQ